jgi:adenylate kinase
MAKKALAKAEMRRMMEELQKELQKEAEAERIEKEHENYWSRLREQRRN